MSDPVVVRIVPGTARRAIGCGMLGVLGLVVLSLVPSAAPAWWPFLVAVGAGGLWLSWRMWVGSATVLELTETEVREAGGRLLARVDQIEAVDRGAFAFKPAGGFAARLTAPQPAVFVPGLWWRLGRRLAVGGVTPTGQGRAMADALQAMIARRG